MFLSDVSRGGDGHGLSCGHPSYGVCGTGFRTCSVIVVPPPGVSVECFGSLSFQGVKFVDRPPVSPQGYQYWNVISAATMQFFVPTPAQRVYNRVNAIWCSVYIYFPNIMESTKNDREGNRSTEQAVGMMSQKPRNHSLSERMLYLRRKRLHGTLTQVLGDYCDVSTCSISCTQQEHSACCMQNTKKHG